MAGDAAKALLVGAYAALPDVAAERAEFYAGLAGLGATGLEIPDHHVVGDVDLGALADVLRGRFRGNVLTAIPGTMRRQGPNPGEGLASTDEGLQAEALRFIGRVRDAADALDQLTGEQSVAAVLVHSAPSGAADADAFARSLEELQRTPRGAALVVEHCDAADGVGPGEKRFLSLADELRVAREVGVHVTVNWGRSVLETHDPETPAAQIAQLADAGLLGGVTFSGAGGEPTTYGAAWADAHLPLDVDEPASLMTAAHVRACLDAARGRELYRAVKVQVPAGSDVPRRLQVVGSVATLLR